VIIFRETVPTEDVHKIGRNILEVYKNYNVKYSYIFICNFWFYAHYEASVRGHEIFKTETNICVPKKRRGVSFLAAAAKRL